METSHLDTLSRNFIELLSPWLVQHAAEEERRSHATRIPQRLMKLALNLVERHIATSDEGRDIFTAYRADPLNGSIQKQVAEHFASSLETAPAGCGELRHMLRQIYALRGETPPPMPFASPAAPLSDDTAPPEPAASLTLPPGIRALTPPHGTQRSGITRPLRLRATLSVDGVHFSYGHALLVGVGSYAHWSVSAPDIERDTEQVSEALCDITCAGYHTNHVQTLISQQATRASILHALDHLAQQVSRATNAVVLVLFAGHGVCIDGTYCLLPYTYDPDNPLESAIDTDILCETLDAIGQHAHRLVLLLNCGTPVSPGGKPLVPPASGPPPCVPPLSFYQRLGEARGRVLIAASRPGERTGTRWDGTLFGLSLVRALRGEAPVHGTSVSVLELFAYLCQQIPPAAAAIHDSARNAPLEQHPMLVAPTLNNDFPIALRPSEMRKLPIENSPVNQRLLALAKLEQRLSDYEHERDAPPDLLSERAALLACLWDTTGR